MRVTLKKIYLLTIQYLSNCSILLLVLLNKECLKISLFYSCNSIAFLLILPSILGGLPIGQIVASYIKARRWPLAAGLITGSD